MATWFPSSLPLPIVERELRVASRRAATYWGRVSAGMATLALVAWAILTGGASPAAAALAGRSIFLTISIVALFATVMTALRLTAPSIAGEKREGTLGLLFLTDLRSRDIVLGKLAVSSLSTFFQFLAAVPVLAIPLLMGGVTAQDFLRLVMVLVNMMFLASAVGMFASALSKDERNASGLAILLMIVVLGAGPVVSLLLFWRNAPEEFIFAGLVLSPGYACVPNLGFGTTPFWVSLGTGHLMAWGLLWLTCWMLPRLWRERPPTAPAMVRHTRWKDWMQGDPSQRFASRRFLLSINPMLWLMSRDRTVRWHPWVFLSALGAIIIWTRWQFDARWNDPSLVLSLFWLVHAIFKGWVSSQSAYTLSADRDRGALELVLSTPLSTVELLRGHWLSLRRMFIAPIAFVLVLEVIWIGVSMPNGYGGRVSLGLGGFVMACLANLVLFGFDIWAAGWVGLWSGVIARNSGEAAGRTQLRIFWAPWFGVMLLQAVAGGLFQRPAPFGMLVATWAVLGVAVDLYFATQAHRRLHEDLRLAAMMRASGQSMLGPGWKARLGRWLGLKVAVSGNPGAA